MLYVIAFTVIALALLDWSLRISRLEMVNYSFRFELFALRDELRNALISGKIRRSNWFNYLDTTITKAIDELPKLSLWEILLIGYLHRNDKSLHNAQDKLNNAFKKEENAFLALMYEKVMTCVLRFILSRHFIISNTILFVFKSINSYKSVQERIANTVMIAPETSTLSQFT